LHNGELNLQNCTISFNGQSWSIGLIDSSRFNIRDVVLNNGFITTALLSRSRVNVYNINIAGEYIVSDNCFARFNKVGFVLLWLNFPDSSRVDLHLPKSDSSYLQHYEIRPGSPGVQGIKWTMIVDSSSNVNWGSFPLKGSDVKIRDSRLRATGLIIQNRGNYEINGLVNNSIYYNWTLPLSDRRFWLDSVKIFTWNIYAYDSINLNIKNSVFGEAIAWGEPEVFIENSICDGTGGYIGTFDSSQVIIYRSTINTQTISGVHSLLIGVESNFRVGEINATGRSLIALINSFYDIRPIANDTSFIYLGLVNPPPNPTVNRIIPVTGTASCLYGPYNPVRFHYYRLLYGPGQNPSQWFQIGTIHYTPIENDTLERWNTFGLTVGWYTLRLIVRNTNGDTLDVYRAVYLNPAGIEERTDSAPFSFMISSANPSRREFAIHYSLDRDLNIQIGIFDVSGRKIKTLVDGKQRAGQYRLVWRGEDDLGRQLPAGVYYCRFKEGNRETRKKLILLKQNL
ncbi:MAG: FlgD immunoglobulin-like domain containing protein, partial [candidate division WOR-3 bacterium]